MKITIGQLRRIIKEELVRSLLNEDEDQILRQIATLEKELDKHQEQSPQFRYGDENHYEAEFSNWHSRKKGIENQIAQLKDSLRAPEDQARLNAKKEQDRINLQKQREAEMQKRYQKPANPQQEEDNHSLEQHWADRLGGGHFPGYGGWKA